jgi:hypothetical protein
MLPNWNYRRVHLDERAGPALAMLLGLCSSLHRFPGVSSSLHNLIAADVYSISFFLSGLSSLANFADTGEIRLDSNC